MTVFWPRDASYLALCTSTITHGHGLPLPEVAQPKKEQPSPLTSHAAMCEEVDGTDDKFSEDEAVMATPLHPSSLVAIATDMRGWRGLEMWCWVRIKHKDAEVKQEDVAMELHRVQKVVEFLALGEDS